MSTGGMLGVRLIGEAWWCRFNTLRGDASEGEGLQSSAFETFETKRTRRGKLKLHFLIGREVKKNKKKRSTQKKEKFLTTKEPDF